MGREFLRDEWLPDTCPFCGSFDVSYDLGYYSDQAQYLYLDFSCRDCGQTWSDMFSYCRSKTESAAELKHSRPIT